MIKYKRVTYNILAVELYGMVYGFDIGAVIKVTLRKILGSAIEQNLYTDSKSLYDYLVKLDII